MECFNTIDTTESLETGTDYTFRDAPTDDANRAASANASSLTKTAYGSCVSTRPRMTSGKKFQNNVPRRCASVAMDRRACENTYL